VALIHRGELLPNTNAPYWGGKAQSGPFGFALCPAVGSIQLQEEGVREHQGLDMCPHSALAMRKGEIRLKRSKKEPILGIGPQLL